MDINEIKERMHSGKVYVCTNEALKKEQFECLEKLRIYNGTRPQKQKLRARLLKEMFAEIGEGCYFEPPFYANWGGKFVKVGKWVYANFNLTLVDDTEITIGDDVMFGPNVTVATAAHPISPTLRGQGAQYNLPVHIEKNVWIGAGAIILPGVTIGENSVIGAGSVVTKNIPPNVVAVGVPCKVIKEITEF